MRPRNVFQVFAEAFGDTSLEGFLDYYCSARYSRSTDEQQGECMLPQPEAASQEDLGEYGKGHYWQMLVLGQKINKV